MEEGTEEGTEEGARKNRSCTEEGLFFARKVVTSEVLFLL